MEAEAEAARINAAVAAKKAMKEKHQAHVKVNLW